MAKRIKTESLLELTFVADFDIHPDGTRSAAVHTVIERPEDDAKAGEDAYAPPFYRSRIVLHDHGTGSATTFAHARRTSVSPRFSPDGTKLAFVGRDEEGPAQLYVAPLGGGEPERITRFESGVIEFAWHPSGDRIAVVSRGDWKDEVAKRRTGRTIDRMFYKLDGAGFRAGEVAQIYEIPVGGGEGKRRSKLKADPHGVTYSADGQFLYFAAARDEEQEDAWQGSVYRLPVGEGDGKSKAEALTPPESMASNPVPSPDGRTVAYFGPQTPGDFASPTALWVVPTDGGEPRRLTDDLEAAPSVGGDSRYGSYPNRPAWTDDGRSIVVNANERGRSNLVRIDAETGRMRRLTRGDRVVTAFRQSKGRVVFTSETPDRPGELFLLDGRKERPLSDANRRFVDTYRLASVEERSLRRAGERVEYWVMGSDRPRDDGALVVQVHGGPHTNYGYGFSFEFQLMAARGYTVAFGNPRLSSSYGARFQTSVLGAYGTGDADDVMAIAAAARDEFGSSDTPVHLTGGSYGGLMTNWLVTQTEFFRSAVTQRSICNWLSFYGASDIGYRFGEREIGGNPWDDTERLWSQSPLKHVASVRTPLLIVHSDEDHRCPVEQAEQFYIALKRIGRAPTRLVRFPDEGHELSRSGRPDRRLERLEAIVGWFEEHA